MVSAALIKSLSIEQGFSLCGVTQTLPLKRAGEHFGQWRERGYDGELEYMSRYEDVRVSPELLLEGAKSVIVCAVNYKNKYSLGQTNSPNPHIASYALCRDYHKTLRRRLKALLRALHSHYPSLHGRCFVDSAPLFEKQLAINAGLGWRGRQSLLITPEYGSFVLLGEIVIDCEVDSYDAPYAEDRCGSCRRCIDSCPASAIDEERMVDTRKCISARTVECEDCGEGSVAGWAFGCDVCQSCCPYNQKTPLSEDYDFMPIITPISAAQWCSMSDEEFAAEYSVTPLKRAGLARIRRCAKR